MAVRKVHRRSNSLAIYPWDDWLRRKEFTLVKGKHFTCLTTNMMQQIRNRASSSQYRLAVRIRCEDDQKVIKVKVVGHMDTLPSLHKQTIPRRLTTFSDMNDGAKFRFVLNNGRVDYLNPVYTRIPKKKVQGKYYNACHVYKYRHRWRTRYIWVKAEQKVGIITSEED